MLRVAENGDLSTILEYLRPNVENCLYMYIDIGKYGLDNDNMKVWLDDDNGISLVVMKYHNSISLFTGLKTFDHEAVCKLIRDYSVSTVTAKKEIIQVLSPLLSDEYKTEYGYVIHYEKYPEYSSSAPIRRIPESELLEAARLVAADEGIGSYYRLEELADQFRERMLSGMGRNYLLYSGEKAVAHYATYAEFEDIAVLGGLVVDPSYRGRQYGGALERYIFDQLKEEGYQIYSFAASKARHDFFLRHDTHPIGEYGKLIRINYN